MIRLEEVTVELGGKRILDRISLEIERGTRTAIVGRSGSGKSTLLKLFNFLLRPGAGRVLFDGRQPEPAELPALRRRMPCTQQEPVLWAETVRDNMLLPFSFDSGNETGPPGNGSLRALLRLVELDEEMLDKPVVGLSGGEKQRVAIASSLALDPDAMLLDEPTSALDLVTAEHLFDNILEDRPGMTLVYVTHSPGLLERSSGQVMLREGRVESVENGLSQDAMKEFLES